MNNYNTKICPICGCELASVESQSISNFSCPGKFISINYMDSNNNLNTIDESHYILNIKNNKFFKNLSVIYDDMMIYINNDSIEAFQLNKIGDKLILNKNSIKIPYFKCKISLKFFQRIKNLLAFV